MAKTLNPNSNPNPKPQVPRHVINPFRQLEDWEAAVAYAASGALGQQVGCCPLPLANATNCLLEL